MIITKLGGGLGNQMFQYAIGRALALRQGDRLLLDTTTYSAHTDDPNYRGYGLGNFNVEADEASIEEIESVKYPKGKLARKLWVSFEYRVLRRRHVKFEPSVMRRKGNIYLEGYWQSPKYFNAIRATLVKELNLKRGFSPAAQDIASTISKSKGHSVSLHVRRGDYVASEANIKLYGSHCNEGYYSKALGILSAQKGDLSVFVFSDDIEWVKGNLPMPTDTVYVSETSAPDYERMMLMALCQSHIIANSTFGWWPAWLDDKQGKTVIAPSVWIPGIDLPVDDILPSEWIRI